MVAVKDEIEKQIVLKSILNRVEKGHISWVEGYTQINEIFIYNKEEEEKIYRKKEEEYHRQDIKRFLLDEKKLNAKEIEEIEEEVYQVYKKYLVNSSDWWGILQAAVDTVFNRHIF